MLYRVHYTTDYTTHSSLCQSIFLDETKLGPKLKLIRTGNRRWAVRKNQYNRTTLVVASQWWREGGLVVVVVRVQVSIAAQARRELQWSAVTCGQP